MTSIAGLLIWRCVLQSKSSRAADCYRLAKETTKFPVPLKLLSLFDPSEPLFDQAGWHPMVIYQQVDVLIGKPLWVTNAQRQSYQGKQAKGVIADLTGHCQNEIKTLLQYGR